MALKRAAGSGDYLTRDELLALGREQALVIFRVVSHDPPREMENGTVNPATAHMLICSGSRKGELHRDQTFIGRGITGTLRQTTPGEDVGARMEVLKRGATEYAAANTPSDTEFEALEKIYAQGDPFATKPTLGNAEEAPF